MSAGRWSYSITPTISRWRWSVRVSERKPWEGFRTSFGSWDVRGTRVRAKRRAERFIRRLEKAGQFGD